MVLPINIRLVLASVLFAATALCASAQGTAATAQSTALKAQNTETAVQLDVPTPSGEAITAAAEPHASVTANDSARLSQTSSQQFSAGSASYEAGDFAAAAAAFATLSLEHPSLAVYYNLGNAYFRLGQYGQAIAAYEKARALNPAQAEVLANLERARDAARVTAPPSSRWEQYARKLSPNGWTILLAVSFWAALGLWLIPAQFRGTHGIWRPSLLALSIAVLIFSAAGLYPWQSLVRSGTVLEADTPLLLAPVSTSPVQTYAQAGQTAERISRHGNFDRIRLPDGTEGWVTHTQFATAWQSHR